MKFTKKELEKLVERADRLHSYWGMPGTLALHHDMTGWGIDERYADTTETTRFRGSARDVAIWLMGFIAAGSEAKPGGRAAKSPVEHNPVWTQQYIDDLPDTAFLIVDHKKATKKDRMGRSHPLSVRHLPYRNKAGKIDKAHLKNAISRAPQTTSVPASVRKAAQERAKKLYARMK